MLVSNMTSPRGNKVANQFIIETEGRFFNDENQIKTSIIKYFQSYDSVIAKIVNRGWNQEVTLDKHYWNYSRTTSKYRCLFLGESTKETEAKIKSGEYKLADLN